MKSRIKNNNKLKVIMLFITLITTSFLISFYILNINSKEKLITYNKKIISSNINSINSNDNLNTVVSKNKLSVNLNNWSLTIPSINLFNIKIKDGIDLNILEKYIGHFPDTQIINGNIGLAAHNRGYTNNYFENIHKLKYKDEIIYNINGIKRVYLVFNKVQIDSYDWSYLETSNKNIITLITCVADKPDKRLAIQGYLKGGNNE